MITSASGATEAIISLAFFLGQPEAETWGERGEKTPPLVKDFIIMG